MSNYKSSSTGTGLALGFALFWLAVFGVGAVGWVMNIVKLLGTLYGDLTLMAIARIVGVFAVPLGAILGFL